MENKVRIEFKDGTVFNYINIKVSPNGKFVDIYQMPEKNLVLMIQIKAISYIEFFEE